MNRKIIRGWVLRICINLGIAVGAVVFLYLLNTYVLGYLIRNSLILYWLEFMAVIAFCTYVLAQAIRHQKN